jgi:hypothetical protein
MKKRSSVIPTKVGRTWLQGSKGVLAEPLSESRVNNEYWMKQSNECRIMGCKANLSIQEKIIFFVFQPKEEKSFAIKSGRRF